MITHDRRFVAREELDAYRPGRLGSSRLRGLFVAGSIEGLAAPTVAIVGTRAPSDAGRRLAFRLAAEVGAAGVCVISGLALGIDSAAHEGSLSAGAPTIGVLGGGHDRFFPPRNRELAARIVAGGGAIVSPYAPDVPARPFQFLARNAVVAGLADGVVVVEAASRSGALNTASWAADLAIPVMAFPGDVDRPKAAGCLALIRDGAVLVRDAGDVLAVLGLPVPSPPPRRRRAVAGPESRAPAGGDAEAPPAPPWIPARAAGEPGLETGELARRIVTRLALGPTSIDALLDGTLPAAAMLACVGELITAGIVVESDDATLRLHG